MIDLESTIIDDINTVVQTYATDNDMKINVGSDISVAPKSFPCVYIYEYDSYNSRNKRITSRVDTYDTVVYEVDVFSDKVAGRKTEAKEILSVIDSRMRLLGFTRQTKQYIDLTNDGVAVKRLLARYTAEVDNKGYIYTN